MPENNVAGLETPRVELMKTARDAARRAGILRRPREAVFSIAQCEEKGVAVEKFEVALEREARETAINYLDSEPLAEVTTGDYKLQRKLERAGHWPETVNVFTGGGTMRLYRIPKGVLSVNIITRPKRAADY